MKPIYPYAFLGALLAVGAATAATTTPVGYNTVKISPGVFNLVGVTLQNPVVASGTLSAEAANKVTDGAANFSTLAAGTYILEITNGTGAGTIQEITAFSGTDLTTPEDITGAVTPGTTTYSLRKASTLNSVFGSNNEISHLGESLDGSDAAADLVLIPNGDGTYKTYYFVRAEGVFTGWFDGAAAAGDVTINYADAVFVRTRPGSAASNLVVTGEVKTGATTSLLASGFNLVNSVAPAGLTLSSSGLSNYVAASADGSTTNADLVLIPDPAAPGTFKTYYYVNAPGVFTGWFDGANDANTVSLDGGFFIRNFGSSRPYTIAGPTISTL